MKQKEPRQREPKQRELRQFSQNPWGIAVGIAELILSLCSPALGATAEGLSKVLHLKQL